MLKRALFFIRNHGLAVGSLAGIGVIVFFLLFEQVGISTRPFFNEKVFITPPPSVYAARDVNTIDHVWGDQKAPVVVVEYSDFECPYCKSHFYTMRDVVNEYQGKVAWVYRHLPLDHRHSKARKEAEAAECAASIGGEPYFWRYADSIYQVTPSNNGLDLGLLPKLAVDLGLSESDFKRCLSSGKFAGRVSIDVDDARRAGLSFTPSSIIFYGEGERSLVIGSQSKEITKRIIDFLLSQK